MRPFIVTIRRIDPGKEADEGEEFVLPVDSPDEGHAIASTLAKCRVVQSQGGGRSSTLGGVYGSSRHAALIMLGLSCSVDAAAVKSRVPALATGSGTLAGMTGSAIDLEEMHMTLSPPVHYSPSVETIEPDEQQVIAELNENFDTILETTAKDYGHAVRSVHAKAHGILKGTLTVHAGLPPELAQGMFAIPGEHEAYLRISTNAGDILPDSISLPRGLALKVLDVEGERLPDAEGRTQNFVLVNGPVFQNKNAQQFLSNLKMLAKTTDRAEGAKEALSATLRGVNKVLTAVGIESPKIQTLGGAPNTDPLGETYFSATPFRYGEYIAKFGVFPVSQDLTRQTDTEIDASGRPDALREIMRSETQVLDMVWEVRVQLCRDLEKQPIEDPTVEWKEEDTPFQTVATIRVPKQDSWREDQVQLVDEEMRFSIWLGIDAHRPLGNINRARKAPYERSAQYRERFNGCPIHEPT